MLVVAIGIPVLMFLLLSLPSVQDKVRDIAETELSKAIALPVSIESVGIAPFNRLVIRGVTVTDSLSTDTIIRVRRIDAGIKLMSLVGNDRLTIDYASVIGAGFHLNRDSTGGRLNAQPMFDALKGNGKKKDTKFRLAVNTVVIRQSSFSYDVFSEPQTPGVFNKQHISVDGLRADISLRHLDLPPGEINARMQRMAFREHCGFAVDNLHFRFNATDNSVTISDFALELPYSNIETEDITVDCSIQQIEKRIKEIPLDIVLRSSSYVTPADFSAFLPVLSTLKFRIPLSAEIKGVADSRIDVRLKAADAGSPIYVDMKASAENILDKDSATVEINRLRAEFHPYPVAEFLRGAGVSDKIFSYPEYGLTASGSLSTRSGKCRFETWLSDRKVIDGNVAYSGDFRSNVRVKSGLKVSSLNLNLLSPELGNVNAEIDADANLRGGKPVSGHIKLSEGNVEFKGYRYASVTADAELENNNLIAEATVYDPNARVHISGKGHLAGDNPGGNATLLVSGINLWNLNLMKNERYRNYDLSFNANASYSGKNINTAVAGLKIRELNFKSPDPEENPLILDYMSLDMNGSSELPYINLRSDFADADIIGPYSLNTLIPTVRAILNKPFPALIPDEERAFKARQAENNFRLNLTMKYNEGLVRFLNLPVSVIYPVEMKGYVSERHNAFELNVDAPYLLQKNKIIEKSSLTVGVDSINHALNLNLRTSLPTKYGLNNLSVYAAGEGNRLDTDISWQIDRKKLYKGDISLSTSVSRDEKDNLEATVSINPSTAAFNDSVWTVDPARILIKKDNYTVENLNIYRSNQYITAGGVVSDNPEDSLTLSLLNFNLDYLFESLGLDNVRLGGDATGVFHASNLLSGAPRLLTDNLHVRNISFNHTVFGDAEISSQWDNGSKGIMLDAEIAPPEADSLKTYIRGGIFPMADSLDLHFDANRIDASFLKPYMEAFATDVSGRASGKARIYGNFKYIDLCGDILAEDFRLGIAVTNTAYTVRRDSIHIVPGRIPLDSITIYDDYGNSGRLNGYVTHKFFKDAGFSIDVTDINRLLCFNITPEINPVWNGRIFGDGVLHLRGEPGEVYISADVRTAGNSYFNLTLSEQEEAGEFPFISFRDKTPEGEKPATSQPADTVPEIIRHIRERMNAVNPSTSSNYKLNLQVDITPDASITLIMNPDTPDRIRAKGEGNMRLVYTSEGITAPDGHTDSAEEMKIYGSYSVTKGSYYFTLQDIIVKDFVIKPGSSITFTGDPDAAVLDLTAYYPVQANLTDLDEAFAWDYDLNRTNVPVHALLNITGDIRQPEIGFDMEFPTLNSDIDRKVRSIVSTEEMMDMQIIYLLALNRFYTPEYMSATTKSNELVSVASSTLSSRLAGILGSLSENWSLAPNVRSSKGDFSDVEVDLALSSSLLNNRLLFNGNFGYRDNLLNTNRFVGDFDIEYLLNQTGSIRLKAYNRYNDQNFYFKTATTTQGVGIMYRIDFDRLFNFKSRRVKADPADSKKKKIIIY